MHFAFEKGDTFRPTAKGLYPKQDKKQEDMLSEFVRSFSAEEFGKRNAEPITDAILGKKIGGYIWMHLTVLWTTRSAMGASCDKETCTRIWASLFASCVSE
jgi:hypothetical protein